MTRSKLLQTLTSSATKKSKVIILFKYTWLVCHVWSSGNPQRFCWVWTCTQWTAHGWHPFHTCQTGCLHCSESLGLICKGDPQWFYANAVWSSSRQQASSSHRLAGWDYTLLNWLLRTSGTQYSTKPRCRQRGEARCTDHKERIPHYSSVFLYRNVFLAVWDEWWKHYTATELKSVPECFVTEINYDFTKVYPLESSATTECLGSLTLHEAFNGQDSLYQDLSIAWYLRNDRNDF